MADYTGFSLNVEAWCKKAEGRTRLVMRKIAFELFTRVILKSPVDTGRFRANWGVMIGQPFVDTVAYVDPTGATAVGKAAEKIYDWSCEDHIWLCNNLPYSIPLEYGHSTQAPAGMVRTSIAEINQIAAKAAQENR